MRRHTRRHKPPRPHVSVVDVEPEDQLEAEGDGDEGETEVEDEAENAAPGTRPRKDIGDLYGVHQPAGNETVADEDSPLGESWLESLDADATEGGPEPEHDVDVLDDSDPYHRGHHSTEGGDPPVADKGSGGPGGL